MPRVKVRHEPGDRPGEVRLQYRGTGHASKSVMNLGADQGRLGYSIRRYRTRDKVRHEPGDRPGEMRLQYKEVQDTGQSLS